jgi:hypothetical protein
MSTSLVAIGSVPMSVIETSASIVTKTTTSTSATSFSSDVLVAEVSASTSAVTTISTSTTSDCANTAYGKKRKKIKPVIGG